MGVGGQMGQSESICELDRLLDRPEPVAADRLLDVLLGLLDRTLPKG